jgi:membrane-associated phospholipid phosphatase
MQAIPKFPLPAGYLWQYHLLLWIQSFHSPLLNKVAVALSFLGVEHVYLFVLPVLIWAVNKKLGMRVAYTFLVSMFVNSWAKALFHVVRPIGVPGIQSGYLSSATSYSMPSGHAQGTMTFWTLMWRWSRRWWLLGLGLVLVFLIGVSRLYLGLHWPMDVLVGWGLGLLLGIVLWGLAAWWSYRQIPFKITLFFAVAIPIGFYFLSRDTLAMEYNAFLLTLGVGAAIEKEFVGSQLDGTLWKRICSAFIGIAGILAIQWGIQRMGGSLQWMIMGDLAVGLWAALVAPWLFLQAGLFIQEESE